MERDLGVPGLRDNGISLKFTPIHGIITRKFLQFFISKRLTAMHEIQFWGLTLMGGIPLLVAIITKPLVPSFFHLSWGELLNKNRRRRPLQRQGESTAWGRSTARGTP
jgi:hypothetical protein